MVVIGAGGAGPGRACGAWPGRMFWCWTGMRRPAAPPRARPVWCQRLALQSKRRGHRRFAAALRGRYQAKANGCADGPLVEALTNASAKVLEWLTRQYGIRFELVEGIAPGHSLSRMHALADRGGATLLSSLYSALGNQSVRLEPGAHVTDLIVDDSQRVTGVRYQRNGKVESVGCDVLILACNGFAANSSLVAQYLPDVRPRRLQVMMAAKAMHWHGDRHSGPSSRTLMAFGARSGDPVSTVAAAVVADDRRATRSIATANGSSTSMRVTRNPLCSFSRNPVRRRS